MMLCDAVRDAAQAQTKGSESRYYGDTQTLKIAQGVSGTVRDRGSVRFVANYQNSETLCESMYIIILDCFPYSCQASASSITQSSVRVLPGVCCLCRQFILPSSTRIVQELT